MDVGRRAVEIRREIESDMAFGLFSTAANALFSVPTIAIEIEQSEPPVILPKALLEGAEKIPAEKIDAAVMQAVKKSGERMPSNDPLAGLGFAPAFDEGAIFALQDMRARALADQSQWRRLTL